MLTAVSAASFVAYSSSDVGSSRCRMSRATLQMTGVLRMGSVVTLQLNVSGKQFCVLCTAWPDTADQLDNDMICVDDSVYGDDVSILPGSWIDAECKVRPPSL